jgi:hypothetical protein
MSQIQAVRNPSNSATCDKVNPRASPSSTERLSSRAISLSTNSSWLRRSRSSFPQVFSPDKLVSATSSSFDEFISEGLRDGEQLVHMLVLFANEQPLMASGAKFFIRLYK